MYQLHKAKISHIIFSFLLFLNLIIYTQQCNQRDKNALLKIKKQFGNPSWTTSWNTTSNCCTSWSNKVVTISCDDRDNVIELTIVKANDITTKFPRAIGDLASLEVLTIDQMPGIHGPIHALTICKLVNLSSLALGSTNLSGQIPRCLGGLKELMHIGLTDSNFTGPIPTSLARLPKLGSIYLKSNNFYGPIPNFHITELSFINIAYNNLTGPIPVSLGQLSKLSVLDLSHNQLTGPLLPSLGQLSSLYWLDLSNNRFTGSIPDKFGSIKDSSYLQLQNNQLTGPIPKSLGGLNIIWVDLSNNQLIGDASFLFGKNKSWTERIILNNNLFNFNFSSVALPPHLFILNISHNNIYGLLPKEIANMSTFDASYNQLCGTIPEGCEKFGAAAFSHNTCLCGSPLPACTQQCNPNDKNALLQIKTQLGNPSSLDSWNPNTDCCTWSNFDYAAVAVNCDNQRRVIELSIQFADDIFANFPPAIGDLSALQVLQLTSMPHLTGQIPSPALCKLTNLRSITLDTANMTGSIPDCIGQLTKLNYIQLSRIGLTGPIPRSLVQLPNLQEINLMDNKLTGPIPNFTTQNNGISSISLNNNNLFGLIPTSLGQLSNLTLLSLRSNQLYGPLLSSFGQLSTLRWLDLSNNRFSGSIPDNFGSLTDSIYLQLQGNLLTGPVPKSLGRVSTTWIDLSTNYLTGDASFLFGKNKTWTEKINLNNNLISFNMSEIELPERISMLNISHNYIYGTLPKDLGRLWSVDVSYNQLCGQIPSDCDKFGANSFAHNMCLCGSPLEACK